MGHVRYRNRRQVSVVTSRYPLPVYTRVLNWRTDLPLWIRFQKAPFPVYDSNHVRIRDMVSMEERSLAYSFLPWVPFVIRRSQLPFKVPGLSCCARPTVSLAWRMHLGVQLG